MATIGNNTGGGLLNQRNTGAAAVAASQGTGARAGSASSTSSTSSNKTITVSETFNSKPKPGDLGVGEVGTYQNAKGQTVYVIGTVNGGLTAGTTSVSNANQKLNKVISKAESAQITNLADENKIEIIEMEKTLADQGLSRKEIKDAVKAESTANRQELIKAKTELKADGYQVLTRDANTGLIGAQDWEPVTTTVQNADGTTTTSTDYSLPITTSFNTSAVQNADGTMSTQWNSLSYTGTGADLVKTNIVNTLDDVNQLKLMYGLNNDIYTYTDAGKTQSTTGVSDAALYSALANDNIIFNETTQNFTLNPGTSNISSLLRKDGGKGFERIIQGVLVRDTAIGDKAFVGTDSSGNLRIQKGENGEFMNGKLVDSGQKDTAGNPIFIHEGSWNTKYNQAGYNSIYVKNADGSFTYMGTPDVGYTHIDKQKGFSLGGFVAQAALSFVAAQFGVPALGDILAKAFNLSSGTANIAAAALLGGGVSAIKGSGLEGILTDAALAGLGQGLGDILGEASKQAGGWTNLADDMARNGLDGYVTRAANTLFSSNASTGVQLATDAAGNVVSALDNTLTSGTQVGTGVNLNQLGSNAGNALATTGNGLLNQVISGTPTNIGGTTAGDILESQMGGVTDIANAVDLNPITTAPGITQGIGLSYDQYGNVVNPATGNPYAPPGVNLSYDAAGNIIGDTGTGLGIGVNLVNPETGALVSPPATSVNTQPTGLLDSIEKATGLSPWQQAALVGGAGLGVVGANVIQNMLNPDIPSTSWNPFPQSSIAGGQQNMLGMPDWWNNLYGRGGYGAGNYLGYDILRGLNIPADVQSLLGINSGQNTGSSLIA